MNPYILLGIVGILVAIILASIATQPSAKTTDFYKEAKTVIHNFATGDSIEFLGEIEAPVTEFIYQEKIITEQVTLENGTQVNQTTTVVEKVPTSDLSLSVQERQSGDSLTCRLGYQCDIKGKITLINPNNGLEVDPPYGFLITIECITSNNPDVGCNNFDTIQKNWRTDADKSFIYTFTTSKQFHPPGEYMATVVISSLFKNSDGDIIEETGTQKINVV